LGVQGLIWEKLQRLRKSYEAFANPAASPQTQRRHGKKIHATAKLAASSKILEA